MKSYVLFFIVLLTLMLTAADTRAQIKKPGFSLGGSIVFSKPQGKFTDTYNFGAGAEAFGGVGWGNTYIMATAGFSGFNAAANGVGALTYAPLKLGLRQFFLKKRLFINGDLGMASVKNKVMNERHFTRGIGAGARLFGFEFGLYYDGWKNKNAGGFSNFADAKVGWNFSL